MSFEGSRDCGLSLPVALRGVLLLLGLVIVTCGKVQHPPGQPKPSFGDEIANITVIKGRDITFTCVVKHLGLYKVGWVKADTKAIQAIHHQVVTHNPRVSVTYRDRTTWNLHIRDVQEDDRGLYMCQVNTDPMMAMMAHLEVVVPPEIIDNETSTDTEVKEGANISLNCKARGSPPPVVSWQREGGRGIVFRHLGKTINSSDGETLHLTALQRSDMGPYLCIAKNGIPPSVSKRILLRVNFSPKVNAPIDMMGSPLGKDVSIKCKIESSPRSVNTWRKEPGEQMIIDSPKYKVDESLEAFYVTHMSLTIRNFSKEDATTYRCVAGNSLGTSDSSVQVYEIPQETRVYKTKDDTGIENHIPSSEYESNTKNEVPYYTDVEENKIDSTYRDPYPQGAGLQPQESEKEVPSKEATSHHQPQGILPFPMFNGGWSPVVSFSLASWWWSSVVLLVCHVVVSRWQA